MNESDYDQLAELLERWYQRAISNGMAGEYARLCHEMEQRRVLYALDRLIEFGAWDVAVTPEGQKA